MDEDLPGEIETSAPTHAEPVDRVPLTHEPLSAEQLQQLYRLVGGYRVSQAMYVAARLDIPGLLADGPRTSGELAEATGTHEGALYRVLRLLTGVGLFQEIVPHRFALTALGNGLRMDVAGSIRPILLMLLDGSLWESWGDLLYSVRTGEAAFDHVHGMGRFEYLHQHPDATAIFDQAMTSNTAQSGRAITEAYDFSGIQRLVDVGGGHGLLLATVLQAYPGLRGILFDRPEVVVGAPAVLQEAGVADRCEIITGDFFASVPTGGDAYILRQIIHDWNEPKAMHILQNCRRSMQGQAKLLVVERRIDPNYQQALAVLNIDLEMLVNLGGAERTDEEYRALFAAAGFQLTTITPLNDQAQFSVFEGVPA